MPRRSRAALPCSRRRAGRTRPRTSPRRTLRLMPSTGGGRRSSRSRTTSRSTASIGRAVDDRARDAPAWRTLRPIISSTARSRLVSAIGRTESIRPSRITAMRSAMANTSARRCDTKIEATPRALRPRSRSNSRSASRRVSAVVGSSRIRTRTRFESARAIRTSCWVARSSVPISACGIGIDTESGEDVWRPRRRVQLWSTKPQRDGSAPRYMFCATVRSGQTFTSCGTMAMPARSASATFFGA